MTQEQAKKYLEDPANWHVHQTGKYVQLSILTYKHLRFARIETFRCLNSYVWCRGEDPLYGFKAEDRLYEMDGEAIGYAVSHGDAWKQIWKESKA